MKPIRTTLAAALLAGVSSFFLLPAAVGQGALTPPGAPAPVFKTLNQIEPRTPISAIPFTISSSGSYYLTTNVTGVAGLHGISINANDVTLDLSGCTVAGVSFSGSGIIVANSFTNVTVRNGTVRNWGGSGVSAAGSASRNIVLEHLTVSANASIGISCYGALVSDCSVVGSGSIGIDASYSHLRDCTVDGSGTYGIHLRSAVATGCFVRNSVQNGILLNAPGCQAIGNTLIANNTTNQAAYSAIRINDAANRIENNHISGSGPAGSGIGGGAGYTGNVIIRNTVISAGSNNYDILGTQIIGPIISTGGTITNSNPWANFSF